MRALPCLIAIALATSAAAAPGLPTLPEVLRSGHDLWGEAAMRQPDGPSYEFFAKLLPPLRYVDAPFRHYLIVLSAPRFPVKARLISNGSGLNVLARQPNWRTETGVPVTFSVGATGETYGQDLRRLGGPAYSGGYLPIVSLRYRQGETLYTQEAFASVAPDEARRGTVYLEFGVEGRGHGKVVAQIEGSAPYQQDSGRLRTPDGKTLAVFSSHWTYNPARNTLTALLAPGGKAQLAIATEPGADGMPEKVDASVSQQERRLAAQTWETLLLAGTQIDVPEPVVNRAWRSMVCGTYALVRGDEIRYSAGNQYAKLYEGEGSDAARSLLLFGHTGDVRQMLVPLFDFTRPGLEYHQAAFKLQTLAHYYRLTRDPEVLSELRPRWEKELNRILSGLDPKTGLLPREKYCGDIDTLVYSLNSNSNCWRALRDMRSVLAAAGEKAWAERLAPREAALREKILAAIQRSTVRSTTPHFVPIALDGEEKPYSPITGIKMGGYWNIMSQYVLGSGVYPPDSDTATQTLRYMQTHGGLCMGMVRTRANPTFWVDSSNINQLYGLRQTLTYLRRDETDRALVTFYGLLAQGFTRDTFIGAEGTSITPLDPFGRQMYLPPNSTANAHFLWALRYLLVQDWDIADKGDPGTLRLMWATPRRWLKDGAEVRVKNAPTAFGNLSMAFQSRLSHGEVTGQLDLPAGPAKQKLLRLRLPEGWTIDQVQGDAGKLPLSKGVIDLSGLAGRVNLRAHVVRVARKAAPEAPSEKPVEEPGHPRATPTKPAAPTGPLHR